MDTIKRFPRKIRTLFLMFKKGHERANPLISPIVARLSAKEGAIRKNEPDTRIVYKWFAAKKATE